jgi:hypothetical protein
MRINDVHGQSERFSSFFPDPHPSAQLVENFDNSIDVYLCDFW